MPIVVVRRSGAKHAGWAILDDGTSRAVPVDGRIGLDWPGAT